MEALVGRSETEVHRSRMCRNWPARTIFPCLTNTLSSRKLQKVGSIKRVCSKIDYISIEISTLLIFSYLVLTVAGFLFCISFASYFAKFYSKEFRPMFVGKKGYIKKKTSGIDIGCSY